MIMMSPIKKYVDSEISKIHEFDPSGLLPLDGSKSMSGNLNMGHNNIIGIYGSSRDDSALTVGDAKATYFPLLGNRSMQGNLNMGNHSITNLKDPQSSDNTFAATVNFVKNSINDESSTIYDVIDRKIEESEERSIKAIEQENVFKKVMDDDEFKEDDDDIHKIGVVQKDFHKIDHRTYEFKIDYDSSIGYYSTRLSIDLVYLPTGNYTMVYEMYVEDGITIDEINATSGTLAAVKTSSKIIGTKTRSVIIFNKYVIIPSFDDLDIDIKLKGKTDPQTTIFVVVYGVSGL